MMLNVLRLGYFVTLIVGGASLARLNEALVELGALGELRFVGILLVATAVALVLLALPPRRPLPVYAGAWIALLVLLHVCVAVSWLWSDRTTFSDTQLYELTLLGAVLWLAVVLCRHDPAGAIRMLMLVFYVVALSFTVVASGLMGEPAGELSALGAGGIGTARVLGMGVLAAALFAVESGRRAWLLPVPAMLAGMLLSGSRAAILALVLSLVFVWARRGVIAAAERRHQGRFVSLAQFGVAAILVAGLLLMPYGKSLMTSFVQSLILGSSDEVVGPQVYLADRDVIFADAWSQFLSHPLGGLGVGSYTGPFGELYPHNLFLGFAVDAGFLAVALCLGLLVYGMLRPASSRFGLTQAALAGALFFTIASLFTGTYYDARFVWLFLMLGLMHAASPGGASAMIAGSMEFGPRNVALPEEREPLSSNPRAGE